MPAVSVAVELTVVVPTGKVCGEVMTVAPILLTTVAPPQLSVAVTLKPTLAELPPGPGGVKMLAGQLMTGAVLSSTVTTCVEVCVLPAASVAL